MLHSPTSSIESRASWVVASVALVTMLMSFGAAWITAVALKDIAAEVGGVRSIPSLASALAWLGSGAGGIMMGRIADRVGTRWTVIFGALMIGVGLTLSTFGPPWPLWIGHGLFIGLIGLGPTPLRAAPAEEYVIGRGVGEVEVQEAGRAAVADLESVPADLHGTADYRKRVGAVMVTRALATAIREAGRDGA